MTLKNRSKTLASKYTDSLIYLETTTVVRAGEVYGKGDSAQDQVEVLRYEFLRNGARVDSDLP